jgi:hypothetical protein
MRVLANLLRTLMVVVACLSCSRGGDMACICITSG